MNRMLSAACAAALLAGTLTACGTTTTNAPRTNTTDGTPSGTSYVAPSRTRYPAGADQDRSSYNRMTSSRSGTAANSGLQANGRYTAYSDGYVYPGRDAIMPDNGTGLAHDMTQTARDLTDGVGDMVRDAGNAMRSAVGGINDTPKATSGQTNTTQRMGRNADNTMLNANAE